MIRSMRLKTPAAALALLQVLALPASAQLLTHRWSFDQAGSAVNGTTLDDRISSAPAVIRGNGASLDGSSVTLPGSGNGNQAPQNLSAYVDLPNGIISSKTDLSIEIWATVLGNRTWQRLFDFGRMNIGGNGEPGELTGEGNSAPGGTQASDSLMLAVQRGSDPNTQRFAGTLDGAQSFGGGDTSATIDFGTRYHFVATYASGVGTGAPTGGGRITWYLDGSAVGQVDLPFPLSSIEDVNNWLGRSQWNGDSNSNIAYDEFRIYDGQLTPAGIASNRDAGPGASIPGQLQPHAVTMHHGRKARVDLLAGATGEVLPGTLEISEAPDHGSATLQPDGSVLYEHVSGMPTGDSFTYRVANSDGQFASATVTITFASGLKIPSPGLNVPDQPPAGTLALVNAFPGVGFDQPLAIASHPGDSQRLFVAEKTGRIRVIPDVSAASPSAGTFLNLAALLSSRGESLDTGGESGLLGVAFHPDHASNREFFVFYSVTVGGSRYQRVSRFTAQAGNPDLADPSSEEILIHQRDEASNHNGGDLHFGPDGYLYIAVGDEGGGDDNFDNSQEIDSDLFAGMLRIDVDKLAGNVAPTPHPAIPTDGGQARFSIPVDNPFVHSSLGGPWDGTYNGSPVSQSAVRREFYATGLRNPWRFSFDPATGELWCGDVGQGAWEEINIIENGANLGWSFREGAHNGPHANQAPANFDSQYHTPPVFEYQSSGSGPFQGDSVTGGLVYRGNRVPSLTGKYLFADYVSGNIWSLQRNEGAAPTVVRILGEGGIVGFGTDPSNDDVLLADLSGGMIHRLVREEADDGSFPATLSETGLFADLSDLHAAPGLVPYEVNLPFWSDHAIKRRWFVVPDGTSRFGWAAEGPWSLPSGTIWVKHFDLELERGNPATARRLETRLIVKNDTAAYGVSYRWNDEQTEAFLVADEGDSFDLEVIDGGTPVTQTWRIPSRAECLTCHTPQAGHALSFHTRQLNLEGDMLGFGGNQLTTLELQDFLTGSPGSAGLLPRHLRADEDEYSVEARVRSYIAVNCAYCHMDGGSAGGADWDGRPQLSLAETGLINGPVSNNLGDPANLLVVPGDTTHSVVLQRVAASNGFGRMPPLATNELDQDAINLLSEWIASRLPTTPDYQSWRLAEFGSDSSPEGEPGADPDFDGANNEAEFLQGTAPLDGASNLSPAISASGDAVTLMFSLPENRSFRVMTSPDLKTWEPWQVPGNQGLPVAGGMLEISGPLDAARRFFSLEISGN